MQRRRKAKHGDAEKRRVKGVERENRISLGGGCEYDGGNKQVRRVIWLEQAQRKIRGC
jgi:hypothetical protein